MDYDRKRHKTSLSEPAFFALTRYSMDLDPRWLLWRKWVGVRDTVAWIQSIRR